MRGEISFLETVLNLANYHREHEKFYSYEPLNDALSLQRISRGLLALADRWSTVPVDDAVVGRPRFAGSEDLNDRTAIETTGVLFMEGEAEPVEITRMKQDLLAHAERADATGAWLSTAMSQAWDVAVALLDYPELADVLGERHQIIVNDWQNAEMLRLVARVLSRATEIIDRIDFTPSSLRADLRTDRSAPRYLYAACELIDRAADLATQSSIVVHENEHKWRVFRHRVEALAASLAEDAATAEERASLPYAFD